ncbi:PMR1-type calcium-transporting P-type ATPase [Hyaloraphidium curvatum]|nr:PMR1-type calcium-transporting P-type ATPase [Hyaloraphidium curvatum]
MSMASILADGKRISPSAHYATQAVEDVLRVQNVDVQRGLSSQEAAFRRKLVGPNEMTVDEKESLLSKFIDQFKNPLILLLFGSATISVLMGQFDDAISITLAIVIVVTVAFVQEYRSEKSLEELNKLVPHHCHVVRDGILSTQFAQELVPGDIVRFSTGDRIPADVRLVAAVDLEVDESSLTGENEACRKHSHTLELPESDLPLAERKNIGFMGTLVRNGHATGVVIATGKETEFGVVFHMMKEVETRKTPLQANMDQLGKQLSVLSFGIIGVIMLIGVVQGRQMLEMFTIGVSLAVAAIPEGLPIVVTVTLALGVLRMSKRHVIIRKLPSVESLGSVNVICVDKTGTLTLNKMTVTKLYTPAGDSLVDIEDTKLLTMGYPGLSLLLRIGNLCNNAQSTEDMDHAVGQPTEVALLDLLSKFKLRDQRQIYRRSSEIPFTFDRKWMAVTCSHPDYPNDNVIFAKGALEAILERCTSYAVSEVERRPLDDLTRQKIVKVAATATSQGLRLISMAYGLDPDRLIFVGFAGMYDPPRPGVGDVVNRLVNSNVKIVMITGDSEGTALAISKRLGISNQATSGYHISGADLENMSDRQLADIIQNVSIFYRATPKHKMSIIRAFQSKGDVVAMTGDGVNDAPALRLADIGISMGKGGTDVAKEAADMILVNDDFSTVWNAIEEGKSIFYNIQNFLRFQLSTSMAALTLIAAATLLGLPNPLNAMQILWINIMCDGPVAQSLGVEAVDPEVMKAPPRPKNDPIITRSLLGRVAMSAALIVLGTLYFYAGEINDGNVTARGTTITFTSFVFFDIFNSLACRSEKRSVFELGLFSNSMYNIAVGLSLAGQLLVIYFPFFQGIFQTEALEVKDLLHIAVVASSVLWIDEIRKFVKRRRRRMEPRNGSIV